MLDFKTVKCCSRTLSDIYHPDSTTSPHEAREPERTVYQCKRHRDQGPRLPGCPVCQASTGPLPETGCTSACRGMGRSERRHQAATHVRHMCSTLAHHAWRNSVQNLLIKMSLCRCIQDKEILVDMLENLGKMRAEVPDPSEDCLYLNIYTPAGRAPDAKLPVRSPRSKFVILFIQCFSHGFE